MIRTAKGRGKAASEIAPRLPDGKNCRAGTLDQAIEAIEVAGLNLKTYARLCTGWAILPRETQGVPLYTRKPGQEQWTEETAYLGPGHAGEGELPSPIKASEAYRPSCRTVRW